MAVKKNPIILSDIIVEDAYLFSIANTPVDKLIGLLSDQTIATKKITLSEALRVRSQLKIGGKVQPNSAKTQQILGIIEQGVNSIFNGKILPIASGLKGLQPDLVLSDVEASEVFDNLFAYVTREEGQQILERKKSAIQQIIGTGPSTAEIKSVEVFSDSNNLLSVGKDVKLQGKAEGFSLTFAASEKEFRNPSGEISTASVPDITKVVNTLRKAAGSKVAIIKAIEANPILKNNIISKAQKILIPYELNGKTYIKAMSFNWEHIKKFANFSAKVNIIEKNGKKAFKNVQLSIKYPSAFINKLLNIVDKAGAKGASILVNDPATAITLLQKNIANFGIQYLRGSIVVSNINNFISTSKAKKPKILEKQEEKPESRGRFINNIQLTILLQRRIASKMPTGGKPNSREGLKYRSGKFVNSLQFTANYKNRLITYFNTPPVDAYTDRLHRKPYLVGARLIGPTVRQVTRELFGNSFGVKRVS